MTRYRVVPTERAEMDLDAAYLWRSGLTGPDHAAAWFGRLIAAIASLETIPRRGARLQGFDDEVRRVLYGHGAGAYQIVYRVYDPPEGEEEGIVRVLHVRRGALPEVQETEE